MNTGSQRPDNPAGALADALAAEAELVDEGGFSVDLRQAGDKLRQFRLADPSAWMLLLVELAAVRGGEWIRFTQGALELEVRSDAMGFDADELASLAVVSTSRRPGHDQGLGLLALAYQALQSQALDELRIESTRAAGEGCRLSWSPDAGERVEAVAEVEAGLRVVVNHEGWLRDEDERERERQFLRERCRCARIDVFLGDEQIARGWRAAFGPEVRVAGWPEPNYIGHDGDFIGLVGRHRLRREAAWLLVLVNGVIAEQIELEADPADPGFAAVIEYPGLRRDLSLGKIARDEAFAAMLELVAAARAKWRSKHGGELERPEQMPPAEDPRRSRRVTGVAALTVGLATLAAMIEFHSVANIIVLTSAGVVMLVVGVALLDRSR